MRKVQIYVNNQLIDLFDDEKIQVKSSVQDINDIAKVFTDFSQSFSVPASEKNNDIFGFYYNNDLDQFNANTRVDCRIEIGLTPFREGKLQLEGGIVKHNQADAYKVTFFGDVVTLKDKFGEDKLSAIDYSSLNFSYTAANVKTSIESATFQDVRFPLISSSRVWTYDTGGASAQDISVSPNAIAYTELFPAISDAKILSLIASHYDVTFTGNFLTDDRLKNSYTWWKNREETSEITTRAIDLTFNPLNSTCNTSIPNAIGVSKVNLSYIDLSNVTAPADWSSWSSNSYYIVNLQVSPQASGTYVVDTYINGALTLSTPFYTSSALIEIVNVQYNNFGLDDTYTFKIRSLTGGFDIDFTISLTFRSWYTNTSNVIGFEDYSCQFSNTQTLPTDMDFSALAPDIKVSDWFSGTLKEFNLTCFPVAPLTFQVEPVEDWYANGGLIDITEFVDPEKIEVDRVKLYNDISFEWQKSKSFINNGYLDANGKDYGSLKTLFPENDGGKYQIKLPFENLNFLNFDTINNNLQVGFSLTNAPDYKPYVPKPVKLYINEILPCSFYFHNGTTFEEIENYVPFGQSTTDNYAQYSMNFGSEFDTLTLNPVNNSLYKTYYEAYLVNLFNSKTRKVTLKCILPIAVLTSLQLNDEVLIRDKTYRINDMTSDLTTGVVQFVLLTNLSSKRGRYAVHDVPAGSGDTVSTVKYPINSPLGGYVTIADPIGTKFITTSPTIPGTFTGQFKLEITVPVNTTGSARYQTMLVTGYNSSGVVVWVDTIIISQAASDFFLLTESGGYLLQENLDKILL